MTLAYLTAALPFTAGEAGAAVSIAGLFAPGMRVMCSHGTIARATSGGRVKQHVRSRFRLPRSRGRVRKALSLAQTQLQASPHLPSLGTARYLPQKSVRACTAWPKFEASHLLSFRLSSSTTVNSDHQPPLPTHSTGSWARSYPTNSRQFRFHQQGGLDKQISRSTSQADQPAFHQDINTTDLSSTCPSKLPPPRWQTPLSTSLLPPPRAPPSAPAVTSRSTRLRTRP